MRTTLAVGLLLLAASASATTINIEAGDDFEASCLMVVEPGDTCYLAKGDYKHDGLTRVHGTEDNRITITGDSGACIKGSNTQDRALQIAHDYYTIEGICFDGEHGNDYVATAIYVLGADKKSTKNGVTSSVTGLQMFDLEIRNFYSECVHFRYFVTHAEVSGCTIQHCGIEGFEEGKSNKVGEGVYVGTALDQVKDGKAPEVKIRSGSADNVEADICRDNHIHHNTFRTYGNECVDVKEGSTNNLIEHNVCEQQQDANSGCFGLRGSENTVRWNEIAECLGAGVRVGGDDGFGEGNNVYGNTIKNAEAGGFNVMSPKQGVVCENELSGVDLVSFGAEDEQPQFAFAAATGDCESYPGDLEGKASNAPDDGDDGDDDGVSAGVNYADGSGSDPDIEVIETNEAAGSPGLGSCGTVVAIKEASVLHPDYADTADDVDVSNLFDSDLSTYFSVHRESTRITFELEEEIDVTGVSLGFFMKDAIEERIQTFDIALRKGEDDGWTTVISRKESSGEYDVMQTFPFSSRTALYVRLETHGNTFNNWSAFTEVEVCSGSGVEENALFGGVRAAGEEMEVLAGEVCLDTALLSPVGVRASGTDDVKVLFDGNYNTRWSTTNTQHLSDLDNDKVQITLEGDTRVSHIAVAFYDGDLAHQFVSIYVQGANDPTWTLLLENAEAEDTKGLQTFEINQDGVHKIYIVGKGNSVGFFSKISEIEVYGC